MMKENSSVFVCVRHRLCFPFKMTPPPLFFDIAAHHCSIFTSICVIINQITHQLPEPAKKFSL